MNADYDYKAFLDDIEEDPEIRANVNKYKDEDVIEELLGKLSLNPTEKKDDVKKSPMLDALDKGEAKVDGQQRKVVKGARKTAQGKQIQKEAEEQRKKEKALQMAQFKQKGEGEDDSDWESDLEEDFPHMQITELLDNLKLDEAPVKKEMDGESEDDDEDWEDVEEEKKS